MNPKISIAMTTYNGGPHLRTQLESLQAQTCPDLEIVVSDDGSYDGSYEMLLRIAESDDRLRILPRGPRLGFNTNFMRCFAACRGELISPCDQDDIWSPEKTARLAAACPPGGVAYCDSRFVDAKGRPFSGSQTRISDRMVMGDNPPLLGLLMNNCIAGHAMIFDRRLLDDIEPIPAHSYFDWWIVLTARAKGRPFRYVDEALVAYRRHDDAVTAVSSDTHAQRKACSLRSHYATAHALANVEAAQAAGIEEHLHALDDWLSRPLAWHTFAYFWRRRREVFYSRARRTSPAVAALGYLSGYPLKRAVRPARYPELRRKSQGLLVFDVQNGA
jgi:glycosyltransferase involved in cell wall biosynthesis